VVPTSADRAFWAFWGRLGAFYAAFRELSEPLISGIDRWPRRSSLRITASTTRRRRKGGCAENPFWVRAGVVDRPVGSDSGATGDRSGGRTGTASSARSPGVGGDASGASTASDDGSAGGFNGAGSDIRDRGVGSGTSDNGGHRVSTGSIGSPHSSGSTDDGAGSADIDSSASGDSSAGSDTGVGSGASCSAVTSASTAISAVSVTTDSSVGIASSVGGGGAPKSRDKHSLGQALACQTLMTLRGRHSPPDHLLLQLLHLMKTPSPKGLPEEGFPEGISCKGICRRAAREPFHFPTQAIQSNLRIQ
jgi:hypothetical protein